jgi:hypothetical protein
VYQLTRAFDPDVGPLVQVTVTDFFRTRPENELERPEVLTLLIDTGATDTALRGGIIDRLRLSALGFHRVHSFGTEMATTTQYSADLELHMDDGARKEFLGLEVCRFDPSYDKIDGLLGRDVLRQGRFIMDV